MKCFVLSRLHEVVLASLIRSSASSTAAGIISLTFGFGSSVLVARMLGADGSGAVAFALWIAITVSTLANLGAPAILLRYMPTFDQGDSPGGGLTRLLLPRLLLPLVLTAVSMIGYAQYQSIYGTDPNNSSSLWITTTVLFVVFSIAAMAENAARGLNRFNETAKLAVVGCILQLPAIAAGGWLLGVPGAVLGYVLRYAPQAWRLLHYVKAAPSREAAILPKMKAYGRNTWFSNVTGLLVWSRVEFLFLGMYFSTTEIGYYAAGLTLAGLVVQLPTQMTAAVTPHIGAQHDRGETERIKLTYHRVMRWLSILILPICFGGAAIMGELIPLLFGTDFSSAVAMGRVLVFFAFVTALSIVPSLVISACERSDFYLYASPIMAIISIASFAAIVPFTGGLGAAWVRAGIHGGWLVWLVMFLWFKLGVTLNVLDLLRIALSASLCALAAFIIVQNITGIFGLIAAIFSGSLIYAASLRLSKAVPEDDVVALLNSLSSALPSWFSSIAYRLLMLLATQSNGNEAK